VCIVCVLYVYYEGVFWRSADDFPRWGQSERACFCRPFRVLGGGAERARTADLVNAIHASDAIISRFEARCVYCVCIMTEISRRFPPREIVRRKPKFVSVTNT